MSTSSDLHIKKNPFLFFLFKLLILLLIVFVLDYAAGKVLSYFYFKQESGIQYRTTYSMEKTTSDMLVFGSSRANHHYKPDILARHLNVSCYNVGREGTNILYHYAVLKSVLKRYTPKIIILDFVHEEFKQSPDTYERLASLLPYYDTHPEVRPIIETRSPYEKLKLLSSIYPYNSSLFTIAFGNLELNKGRQKDFNGYIPLSKVWNGPAQTIENIKYEIDNTKLKTFESFITDCLGAGSKVFIFCSPYFVQSGAADYSVELAQQIAQKHNVLFIDYTQDSAFIQSPRLFEDVRHLNDEGAEAFTKIITEQIAQRVQ